MASTLSWENFTGRKCVLCYSYLDSGRLQQQQLLLMSAPIISTCVKHIPNDIYQTVSWTEFDDSNVSSTFCTQCYDIVGKVLQCDQDLEKIQKKINTLVDFLVSHIRKQRRQNCAYSEPNYFSLDTNVVTNVSQSTSEKHPGTSKPVPVNSYNEEKNNDTEIENSLDYGNTFESQHSREKIAEKDKNCISQSKVSSASLKTFVMAPEQVEPKSDLQKVLEDSSSGYPCPSCHKRFSRYTVMKTHDCSKPTVECETCGMSFSSAGVLKIHLRSHTGEKPYKCETCGKAFATKGHLTDHMSLHTGEKFECEICHKTFSLKSNLVKHKSGVHTSVEEKLFKCDVCSKNFKNVKDLKTHMAKHSSGTPSPFKCDICEKAFASSKSVIRHKKSAHSNQEPSWKCHLCEKRFLDNYGLKRHILTHNDDKPFVCSYCGKTLKSEKYLQVHESTHIEQNGSFNCTTCEKSFKSPFHLRLHQRHHKREFKSCGLCGKSVATFSMKNHLKTSHGSEAERRPYVCEICAMRFTRKKSLESHHKHYCHICRDSFHRRSVLTLLVHQKQIHTVNSSLYPGFDDPKETESNRNVSKPETSRNSTERRSGGIKSEKDDDNYENGSSEEMSENEDSDRSIDMDSKMDTFGYVKVEIKTEDVFSEIEDEFSAVDNF